MKKLLFGVMIAMPVWAAAQLRPVWRPFLEIKPDEARVRVVKAESTYGGQSRLDIAPLKHAKNDPEPDVRGEIMRALNRLGAR